MLITAVVIAVISIAIVASAIALYNFMPRTGYFENIADPAILKGPLSFYIKKHLIFRLFFLMYSVGHHFLNVIAVTSSMIAIYMVLDDSVSSQWQSICLLISAISTSFIFGFRFDRVADGYVHGMRIMEKAILSYVSDPSIGLQPLCDANNEAEQYICNKFF